MSVQDVDQELKYVARVLCDAAEKTLPLIQPRKPQRWKDDTLTALCAQSRSARRAWKDAGCPSEGPLFEITTAPRLVSALKMLVLTGRS